MTARPPAARRKAASPALRALTLAALALPGMRPAMADAGNDSTFAFQYSRYQEGERDIYTPGLDLNTGGATDPVRLDSSYDPIRVDSLRVAAQFALPRRSGLALDYFQDTWSGATPISTAPVVARHNVANTVTGASPWTDPLGVNTRFFVDKQLNIYRSADGGASGAGARDDSLTHTLSSASPETRKQFGVTFSREWNEAGASAGAGYSHEPDFKSAFVNLGGRLDFNQKLTSVNGSLAYTDNQIYAIFDPEPAPFVTLKPGESLTVRDSSDALAAQVGLSQVLSRNGVLDVRLGYTHSDGYLTNPYKLVAEFDVVTPVSVLNGAPDPRFVTDTYSIRERRPDNRDQWSVGLGYRHYIAPVDAALRLDYQYSQDTWDIRSHALEVEWAQPFSGWILTPRLRYYSQSASEFYLPYIGTFTVTDDSGNPIDSPFNRPAPAFYSSDHRLSGFGTLSGGLIAQRSLGRGVGLEIGLERYVHAGDLKLGGGGEGDYADFDAWTLNAVLQLDLDARDRAPDPDSGDDHTQHAVHRHAGAGVPAGLMFGHALARAGDFMVGYHAMHSRQAGDMLHGTHAVSLDTVRDEACGAKPCETAPDEMNMTMHMLDLMYAPTGRLTLMAMPQWMDMNMILTPLDDGGGGGGGHGHGAGGGPVHGHETGGLGDTVLAALYKLLDSPAQRLILGNGISAPTGDVEIALRYTPTAYAVGQVNPTLIHYGMQLGSGTWDWLPSLTYTGRHERMSWGAQLGGVVRLEDRNESNFAFGNIFNGSLWGGYRINHWLATTLRAVYQRQGDIEGAYPPPVDQNGNVLEPVHQGSVDQPANYGGRFWDAGVGVSAEIMPGAQLGFEWLQPVYTDFNGYQLDRASTFALNFVMHF